MLMLYLFCFIVGGGLLAFSVIGGHDHDPSGAGADHGPDTHGADSWASYFSLRAAVSFAAFFGLGGLAARGLGLGGLAQLGFALICGLLVGAFAAVALRLARTRGETATQALALTGRTGKVTVAPVGGQPGKIELIVAGQTEQLLARSGDPLHPGDRVIVIGVDGGLLDVKAWEGS
ncbi:NfeD family protein [Deinococcus alpinitundrae]|uniref:NfeD family protein n=1 Tax=Deinococcus alpinitundrae TaxID=468913 RepID=UPI00137AE7B9|nr:NfeD family protein [Deinococcus alpinitundrae]